MSGDNPLSVDHYHYFSQADPNDPLDLLPVYGVARTMSFANGKYFGSYCYDNQLRRTAISEHQGLNEDWETRKLQTVRVGISSNI